MLAELAHTFDGPAFPSTDGESLNELLKDHFNIFFRFFVFWELLVDVISHSEQHSWQAASRLRLTLQGLCLQKQLPESRC